VTVTPTNANGVPSLLVAQRPDDAPRLMHLHGGSYCLGSAFGYRPLAGALALAADAGVLVPDYRLAPEHPFPAAVEDTVAALMWLSHVAGDIDPTRIAVAGDSAGGGLAAVALHETKGELAAPARAQVLIYPALDLRGRMPSRTELADHFPIPREMIGWFFDHYFGSAWPFTDPRAIPSLYEDYTGLPPALIITAGHDPLRDEGEDYGKTLAAAGVPVEYECCEGTIHGFMNMGRVLRSAHGRARKRLAEWLVAQLRA
jgi:acetyl esterase